VIYNTQTQIQTHTVSHTHTDRQTVIGCQSSEMQELELYNEIINREQNISILYHNVMKYELCHQTIHQLDEDIYYELIVNELFNTF